MICQTRSGDNPCRHIRQNEDPILSRCDMLIDDSKRDLCLSRLSSSSHVQNCVELTTAMNLTWEFQARRAFPRAGRADYLGGLVMQVGVYGRNNTSNVIFKTVCLHAFVFFQPHLSWGWSDDFTAECAVSRNAMVYLSRDKSAITTSAPLSLESAQRCNPFSMCFCLKFDRRVKIFFMQRCKRIN